MKKLIFITMLICTASISNAQYKKVFFKEITKEFSDYTISVESAVNTAGEAKFKLKITNKTNDYIIFKPEESKFVIDGKEYSPKEKWLIIGPSESDFRVVNIKGNFVQPKNYTYKMDGVYKIPANVKGIETPNFKLPASQNDFTTGPFSVSMTKLYKESDATRVDFDVNYTGNQIGLVFFTKAAVKMPDGNEYASLKPKSGLFGKPSAILLIKGGKDDFQLKWDRMEGGKAMDMQKVAMSIIWNGTFVETTPIKANVEEFEMEFDQALSDAKGK
jgi:hypothetical protein